jgi:hypothetical protein
MRMQKEEKIVVVLLLMALGSLAVAFWAFGPEDGAAGGATAKKDKGLSVEGLVLEMNPTKSGGNLLLRLDSTPLSIFVPASAGAGEVQGKIKPGDRVRIRGTVSEYQGTEELRVARAGDVEVAN